MEGFTNLVEGSLGPPLNKVRAAVARVRVGDSRERLIECLGPPDEVRLGAVSAGGRLQGLLENVAGGDTRIRYGDKRPLEETLVYRDPFRPRRSYLFGIRAGVVQTIWQETASAAAGGS